MCAQLVYIYVCALIKMYVKIKIQSKADVNITLATHRAIANLEASDTRSSSSTENCAHDALFRREAHIHISQINRNKNTSTLNHVAHYSSHTWSK